MLVGLVSFFSAFGGGGPPRLFWCSFVGMPLLFVCGVMTKFGFMGAIIRYQAGKSHLLAKILSITWLAKLMTIAETAHRRGHRPSDIYFELLMRPPDAVMRRLYAGLSSSQTATITEMPSEPTQVRMAHTDAEPTASTLGSLQFKIQREMNWALSCVDPHKGIAIETKRLQPAIEKSLREVIAINPANRIAERRTSIDSPENATYRLNLKQATACLIKAE